MSGALETLFYYIQNDTDLNLYSRVLYANARFHDGLADCGTSELYAQQYFKPYADMLTAKGYKAHTSIDKAGQGYDLSCLLLPKNMIEGRYMIAQCLNLLSQGGRFVCAADNNSGGGRLKKLLREFGCDDVAQDSRNKAKVVSCVKNNIDQNRIDMAIADGAPQHIMDGQYMSVPGVFGWNKIDTGSKILADNLPDAVGGVGADFGCGYGYLSDVVLSRYESVSFVHCIDADARSVNLCLQNLDKYKGRFDSQWMDLTLPPADLNGLDFVIMNPPFHEGRRSDSDIGVSFVRSAHMSLRAGGNLYMVANSQLPYEGILNDKFSSVRKVTEENGFKVYYAIK